MKSQLKRVVLTGAALSAALVAGAISAPAASAAPAAGAAISDNVMMGTWEDDIVKDRNDNRVVLGGPKASVHLRAEAGPNVVKLAETVLILVESLRQSDEAGIVQGIRNDAMYASDCQKNVMVIKDEHPKKLIDIANADGSEVVDVKVEVKGADAMRLLVFDSGTVVNEGHGGFPNWAFTDPWERENSSTAHFKPIENGGGCG